MNNYTHLLNRAWDTKEKVMLYSETPLPTKYWSNGNIPISLDKLIAITNAHLIFSYDLILRDKTIIENYRSYEKIPIGDRFIPLLCSGFEDKNNKLIYEHDIVRDNEGKEYVIEIYESGLFIANTGATYYLLSKLAEEDYGIEITDNVHLHFNRGDA